MCRGRVAHPLLISLANIRMKICNKALAHVFLLLVLLPIPHFMHQNTWICSVLEVQLFHKCLNIIIQPLKMAAYTGRMMSDPVRSSYYCFTPLASFILDLPKAGLMSYIWDLTSPISLAKYDQFGDLNLHPCWTGAGTLTQLQSITVDLDNVEEYFAACKQFRLSSVSHPFFWNWALSCPLQFLMPECLHYWHRFFWDHDLEWYTNAPGKLELDFCFSILPAITGLHHFSQGVMKLKQVTGQTQRDAQQYIITVLVGYPNANVVTALQALMDFCYLAQALVISSTICNRIATALADFHDHKHSILKQGPHHGGKTDVPLDHFNIPKLELIHTSHSPQYQQCWKYDPMDCRHNRTCPYWSCEGSCCYDQQHELQSTDLSHSWLWWEVLPFQYYNHTLSAVLI